MDSKEVLDKDFWMVRAGTENELIDPFYEGELVAIGWGEIGNLTNYSELEDIENELSNIYNNKNRRQISGCAGQLFRFAREIDQGDIVLTYNQSDRTYLAGEVSGPYLWNPPLAPETYPHVRQINWRETVHRDEFGRLAKNTLGSSLTVFSLEKINCSIIDVMSDSKSSNSNIPTEAQL